MATVTPTNPSRTSSRAGAAALALLFGSAVAVAIGVYGKAHDPALKPLWLFGFSGMLQLKTWLATAAVVLVFVQIATGVWMYGNLPGFRAGGRGVAYAHRYSGALAFVLLVPVALHCLWSLGFSTGSTRVMIHSVAGCAFYGAYAAKMLGLRLRGTPGWLVPVLGGLVFAIFIVLWLTSALWFFDRSGLPLT